MLHAHWWWRLLCKAPIYPSGAIRGRRGSNQWPFINWTATSDLISVGSYELVHMCMILPYEKWMGGVLITWNHAHKSINSVDPGAMFSHIIWLQQPAHHITSNLTTDPAECVHIVYITIYLNLRVGLAESLFKHVLLRLKMEKTKGRIKANNKELVVQRKARKPRIKQKLQKH